MKTTRTPLWRRVIASVAFFALLFTIAPPVETAQAATFAIANVAGASQTLGASVASAAALQITFSADEASQTLTSVKVTLADDSNSGSSWSNGVATSSDLADLATGATSGIALYKDDSSNGTQGTFEAEDDIVTLTSTPVYASATTFILNPASDPTLADGDIYFVVFKPKSAPTEWHRFTASIAAQDDIVTSGTNPTIAAAVQSNAITLDAVPTVGSAFAQPYDLTKVMVFFSEPVTVASATCVTTLDCASIYTVSGSNDVNSVTSMAGPGATATDAVELNLTSAATNGTTTVTPTASTILDDEGNAVASGATTLNFSFPPFLKGVRLVSSTRVALTFDQAMNSTTTNVTARYTFSTANGGDTETVTAAALQGDTLTVWVDASAGVIAAGDSLTISGIENIQSASGLAAFGDGYFTIDGTAPYVVGGTKDTTNNYIYIRFNEMLDMDTANTSTDYVPTGGTVSAAELMWYNSQTSPSWMTPEMGNKVVKLTVNDASAITQIVVNSTNVKDMAGNAVDNSNKTATFDAGATVAITISGVNSAAADDGVAATRTLGSWSGQLDGCSDDFGNTSLTCNDNASSNNRDAIYIPFTGAIDVAALGESASGAVIPNIGSFIEIYDQWTSDGSATSQADCYSSDIYVDGTGCVNRQYANLGDSYGVIIDNEDTSFAANTNSIANDVLVVYLKGWPNVWDNMQVNPFGIKGLNGMTATQHATASYNRLPMPTFAEVEFVKSTRAGASFADADTVTIFFNADMTRTDVDDDTELAANIKPQRMMPWAQHTWGTGGSLNADWGNHTGVTCTLGGTASDSTPDCLKITMGGSPTVVDGDEIMIMNLNSTAGMPIGWGGKVDLTAPTVSATLNADDNTVTIVFSEEMVENDADGGTDYANNITFDGSAAGANAVIDTSYSSDGFTAGIKLLTDSTVGGMTTWDDMWVPIKKFKLKLTLAPDTSDTITFTNLLDEGGNAVAGAITPSSDAVAPTIYKVIQNDWNGDGNLNAWDEIIMIFDGAATAGLQASDVDYGTITDPNTDFIVKRSSSPVTSAFGTGAGFWVDQWEEHAGELHINLGQGADIQAGDEIWAAAAEVTDLSGNAMQSATAQLTLASVEAGEISKIVYTDGGTLGTVDNADTFAITFNTAIDPTSCGSYTAGGTPEVESLDWCLPLEHNWDSGGSYTYVFKTWGSATGDWDANFEVLTITLAGGDSVITDNDMVQTWSLVTDAGGRVNKPGTIDVSKPTLASVKANKTLGTLTADWDASDTITLTFSEPMSDSVLSASTTVGDAATATGIASGNFGDAATFAWLDPEKRIFQITLGGSGISLSGSTTFDPAATVTDINGNADNTAAPAALAESSLTPASGMSVADADTTYSGIDGRDLTVSWTTSGADKYLIYLLPEFVRFDASTHNPIGIATTSPWTGPSSLMVDSRSTDAAGAYDSGQSYFPLNEWDNYDVFIVASNTAGTDTASPAKSSTVTRFTMEYGSDGQAPWVEGSMPWDGAKDIPTNSKNFSIKFNEAMSRGSIEADDNPITLQKKGSASDWSNATSVAIYASYDETNYAAIVEPQSDLVNNSEYRITVTTLVTDQGGTALTSTYYTHFSTSGTSDTIGPKVETYFFDGSTATTNIPRNTFSVSVAFNENMDPATFTSSGSTASVTLTPSVAGSSVWYDPMMRSLNYILGESLLQNTEYTLTLSGVYIKDTSGNTLDGDANGTAAASTTDNYTLSFTTVNTALSTTKPTIDWIDSDTKSLWAGFSDKMDKAAVEDKSNWTLTQGSTVVSLQTATFFFDGFMNELRAEGLSLTSDVSYTLTPSAAVTAMNGQDLIVLNDCADPAKSCLTFTPWNNTAVFNSSTIAGTTAGGGGTFNGDMFAKMGDANVADDMDFKMFMPISVWPQNRTEGKTSNYHINFPTTKAIQNGGKIILEFPSSFNVTSAAVASDSSGKLYFFNQDINGPGGTQTDGSTFDPDGKVQISSVSANNQTKKITLTLAVEDGVGCTLDSNGVFEAACTNASTTATTTMPYDFIDFELSGIINGDAAEIDWFNNTGGYEVSITTKNAAGQKLEGPIKSMKFDIKEAGNGSISGKVFGPDGVTGVSGAKVWLDSPMAGHQETTTDASGNYAFSGLPVAATANEWDGWYNVMVEAAGDSDYTGHQNFNLQLTTSNANSTGNNVTFGSASNTITLTITHTGDTLDGKDVMIWASGPNGWKEKKVTLDADGSTAATMKVDNGWWDFGLHEYFEMTMFGGGGLGEQDFMPPQTQQLEVSGNGALTFVLATADKTISGVVTDGTSGLANVHVYAYNPSGMGSGGGAETASDGSYKLKVVSGTYTVGANKPGLPSTPERTVTVGASNVTGINFALEKSGSSVSGTVGDGTNSIAYTSINAWTDDGRNAWASTDQSGDYTLFLDAGTWNIEAFAPGFGRIELASGVTSASNISSSDNMQAAVVVAADSTTSGLNFSVASATYYTISGQILDGNSNAVANAFVWADEVDSTTKVFMGNGNEAKTDSTGNFTIKVKANGASTRYQLGALHPDYGDIKPDSSTLIDVSSANSTGNDFTVLAGYSMTIAIINGEELEDDAGSDPADIAEAFVDLFSTSSDVGNHKRFKTIELSSGAGSAGTIDVQSASSYQAKMHIPGVGEFNGTKSGNTEFNINSNGTITFDLGFGSAGSVLTFGGTVTDGADPVENAWVNVMNITTYESFGTATDSSGDFSIKVPDGTYNVRVDKPGFNGAESSNLTATDASLALTLTTADSTITGTIYASDGVTAVTRAFVWAEESSGNGWAGAEVNSSGAYSLAVPTGTTWNISSQSESGSWGSSDSTVAAGASNSNITLASTMSGAAFITDEPKVASMTPSAGGVFDDSDNTGVKMTIPADALGNSDSPGNISAKETASLPSTGNYSAFGGIGKEITAADSFGTPITDLNKDVTIDFTYAKSEVESFASASDSVSQNGLEEVDDLQNSYWDATAQSWVTMSTTKTAYVKNDAADEWTATDFDTFFTNVTGEGDNTANGGGTQSDYYDDYKVVLTSTTDHFTIFGTITGSDGDAPATPTGLATTPANGSVTLDWSDNSEPDLMEYQVFRGATSGFTCNDASQINTSQVAASAYTDSTPTADADYTYYYKLKSVDTSGNESSCSAGVVAAYTYSGGGSSSGGGGGGGGSSLDLTTPYKLPTTESSSMTSLYRPLELSQTEGVLVRPVKLYSYYAKTLAAEIPKDTKVTTTTGATYTGSVEVPKTYTAAPTESATGVKTHAVFTVGSSKQALRFDKPVTLTIPLTLADTDDVSKVKVFYYDGATNSYKLAGDGGTVSSDKTKIVVEVDHFTTFVVFETDTISVAAGGGTPAVSTTSTSLTDISGQWFTSFVDKLVAWGAVAGYSDGTFRPANSANRAEMAKIIAEAFDLTIPTDLTEKPFSDVPADAWFAPYVAAVKTAGIVSGYSDGTFRPANSINRAEALKMAIAATGQPAPADSTEAFSDVPTDAWFARFVVLAKSKNIVSGSPVQTFVAAAGAELYTPAFANYYSSGSMGAGVKNLKLVLQQLGHFTGTVDENYDEAAFAAVKSYQSSAGIAAVGSFGPVTRQSLNYKVATQKIQIPTSGDLVEKTIYLFRPSDSVNRAEIAKIVVQAKEAF